MHFGTKSYLKSTRNHTAKHALSKKQQKSMGYNRVFPGHSGRQVSRVTSDFFFSYFFQPSLVLSPGPGSTRQAEPGFKIIVTISFIIHQRLL
jgi:hypothetical protein